MNALRRFYDYLYAHIGLDVSSVGESMIERAVRQRSETLHCAGLDDYWYRLQADPGERQALIEAVVVPETWFFRYGESFTALARLARERAGQLAGSRPLRLLSLPCSTGEEPYSIAMALLDAGLAPTSFRVDGWDISPQSVAKGLRGVYGRNAFRGADLQFRERFFTEQPDGAHLISPRVRDQVRLDSNNLFDPTLVERQPPYDFVFCRNLLIYFDLTTQQRAFEVLKRLTDEQGVLFIGPAEGSLLARLGMRPLGIPQAFAYVRDDKPAVAPSVAPPAPMPAWQAPAPRPAVPPMPPKPLRIVPEAPVRVAVPAKVADGAADTLLERIAELANLGQAGDARAACERYLGEHGPHAQVYYWLGLLSDTSGDRIQAQGFYRKALYLQPQHAEALAQLAALLAARGDDAGARRLAERAARAADNES